MKIIPMPGQTPAKSVGVDKASAFVGSNVNFPQNETWSQPSHPAVLPQRVPTLMPVWMLWIFWLLVCEGVATTTRTLLFPQLKRASFARADAVSKAGSCLLSTTNSTSTCPPALETADLLVGRRGISGREGRVGATSNIGCMST